MDTFVFSVRFHFPFQPINFSLHPLSIILLFQSISSCSLYLLFFLALFLLSLSVSFSLLFSPFHLPYISPLLLTFSLFQIFSIYIPLSLFSLYFLLISLSLSFTPLPLCLSVSIHLSLCKLSPKD